MPKRPTGHGIALAAVALAAVDGGAAEPAAPAEVVPARSAAPVAAAADGWQSLFDGRDLAGWDGDPRMWSVRDGVIHGETTSAVGAVGNTFLIREDLVVRDFELRFSYRCNATNNSGCQYRSRHVTDPTATNRWVVRGYQHELRNQAALPDVAGFLYDEGGPRRRICLVGEQAEMVDGRKVVTGTLIDSAGFARVFRLDDWNDVRIVAQGSRLRHHLNERLILDFTDAPELAPRTGIVAFQLHAGAPMWVEFRDVAVRHLPAAE